MAVICESVLALDGIDARDAVYTKLFIHVISTDTLSYITK